MKKGVVVLACVIAWHSMAFTAEQAVARADDRVEYQDVQDKKTFIDNVNDPIRKVLIGLAVATAIGGLIYFAKHFLIDGQKDKYSTQPLGTSDLEWHSWFTRGK